MADNNLGYCRMERAIEEAHTAACRNDEPCYLDPETGFSVFTADHLLKRQRCCGSGCRHCPYRHVRVKQDEPLVLSGSLADINGDCDILFWSGGKDSFLAYRALVREQRRDIVLLTTFDKQLGVVAHQEVRIELVMEQARAMGAVLLGVPLSGSKYSGCIEAALQLVQKASKTVVRLAFGDLHLAHIRDWRHTHLQFGLELTFPVWKVPYEELWQDLKSSGASVTISAVDEGALKSGLSVGDTFDPSKVPDGMDRFGENGEFHTLVKLPS